MLKSVFTLSLIIFGYISTCDAGESYYAPYTKNLVLLGSRKHAVKVNNRLNNVNIQVHHRRDLDVHNVVNGRIHTNHITHTTIRRHWHDNRARTSSSAQRLRVLNATPRISNPWDGVRGATVSDLQQFLSGSGSGANSGWVDDSSRPWGTSFPVFQNRRYIDANPWFPALRRSGIWVSSFVPSRSWPRYDEWRRSGGYFAESPLWRSYWNQRYPNFRDIWTTSLWPSSNWNNYRQWVTNGGGFNNQLYMQYFDTHPSAWPKPKWLNSWTPDRSWEFYDQWRDNGYGWDNEYYQSWWNNNRNVWPAKLKRSWIYKDWQNYY